MATERPMGRGREREIAGVLSFVSLAIVFAAVLGYIPDSVLPTHDGVIDLIPHINVVLSLGAISTIVIGILAIRRGDIDQHRQAMLASTALFGVFLVCYLYRLVHEGPTTFEGPSLIRTTIYLPILAIHILFAMVCLPFVYYALALAGTHRPAELSGTHHPFVGRIGAALWIVSFSLGIVVYLLLYVFF